MARGPDGFVLCQRKYALDIIYEEGLLEFLCVDLHNQLDNIINQC